MDTSPHFASVFTASLFFLIAGIDQALVHFFAIGYVRGRFDVRGNWVNGVFAAFAIGSVLLEPIFGHLSERKFNCRNLLLISNIFFILGNIIFSIDTSIGLLIFGRLIAGIASGLTGTISGNILRATSNNLRLPLLTVLLACRQIGLVIGSAIDKGLLSNDYHFGFHSSNFTTPGITLAMIGVFAQIVYIFLYQDRDSQSVGEFLIEPEKLELSGSATSVKAYGAAPVSETEAPKSENKIWTRAETLKERFEPFFKPETLVTLLVIFTISYSQSALEFSFTELTRKFYGIADNLSDTNAALSCIILVCLALATAFVTYKVARDPIWLGIGLVLLLISLAWLTGSIPDLVSSDKTTQLIINFPIMISLAGFPLSTLSCFSILSKLTPDENQCFVQSVARCIDKIAFWLGLSFSQGVSHVLFAFFGFILTFNVITTIIVAFLAKRFLLVDDKSCI